MNSLAPTPADVLALPLPREPREVAERLKLLETALPNADGVTWFTRLYVRVSEAVNQATEAGLFLDRPFIEKLDVRFVELFFNALRSGLYDSDAAPPAWTPLFEARNKRGIAPIQFALAGANAHINRDLCVALVDTAEAYGIKLARGSAQHQDFERVNGILAGVEKETKVWFTTGFVELIDRDFSRVDDVIAIWSLQKAREAAWSHAEALAALFPHPEISTAYLGALDRLVGFASRGLLVEVALPLRTS